MIRKIIILSSLLALSFSASATVLLTEDFESGLNFGPTENWNWTKSGLISADPLQSDNALHFSILTGSGDLFSNDVQSSTGTFNISFDYLGTCQTGNCGGFFWNSITGWDGTTTSGGSYRDPLIDDGTWHSYSFDVSASSLEIRMEDWSGSGGVAGDAWFDNVLITDGTVPEPSVIALFGLGLAGLGFSRRRIRK